MLDEAVPGCSDWESEQRHVAGEGAALCPKFCSDWQTLNVCPT